MRGCARRAPKRLTPSPDRPMFTGDRLPEDIPADLAALIRIGTVTSVDLANARCIVRYGDPDDDEPGETPPIRWLAFRAGHTRIWSPPSVGEQVLLLAPDGQLAAAIALTGIVQHAFPPAGSDETQIIEFADGARISYDAQASTLSAILPGGATAVIEAPGGITLRGDVTIEGKLSVGENATIEGNASVAGTTTLQGNATLQGSATIAGALEAEGVDLAGHVHSGVTTGSGKTSPPD